LEEIKYSARVKSVGAEGLEFLKLGIMILFDEDAPKDLLEICVSHERAPLESEVMCGDFIEIVSKKYEIIYVGKEVNSSLKTMGHATIRLNWDVSDVLPGDIVVSGESSFHVKTGDMIKIVSAPMEETDFDK